MYKYWRTTSSCKDYVQKQTGASDLLGINNVHGNAALCLL